MRLGATLFMAAILKCTTILTVAITMMVVCAFAWPQEVAASETVKGIEKDFEVVKKDLSARLDVLGKQIEELRIRAKSSASAGKKQALADLEAKKGELQKELDMLKADGKKNWRVLKDQLSKSIESLHERIQNSLKQ